MTLSSSSACRPATAVPAGTDVTTEVGADVRSSTACQRLPCPHCILGVGHAACLEETKNKWHQIVLEYSRAGTGPDEAYWMRLMACQWICCLEVTTRPRTTKSGNDGQNDVRNHRGSGKLKGPMKVQVASLPPPRYVQRAEQGPAPPRRGPLQPASEHQDKDQQSTRREGPEVWCVPDAETEPAGPCSASADVACTLFEPPPGLDAPANVNGWPVWQFEQDPWADEWMAMNQALNWHLEESFQRGIGEATFCLDGVNCYFDLVAMYQEEPFTGTERRIRRRVI